MINAYELATLTDGEAEQAAKAEELIDAQITAEYEKDTDQKSFNINRKELNTAVGGMSVKVQRELSNRYTKNGWKHATEEKNYVFTMKSRRGRKAKKVEDVEKAEAVEVADTVAV